MSEIVISSDERLSIRNCLETITNPNPKIDYLTSLKQTVSEGLSVSLMYVPDKRLLKTESFLAYLTATSEQLHEPFEAYAQIFLDDFNNEVVPRWVRVEISQPSSLNPERRIILVDQQPRWQNLALLSAHLY